MAKDNPTPTVEERRLAWLKSIKTAVTYRINRYEEMRAEFARQVANDPTYAITWRGEDILEAQAAAREYTRLNAFLERECTAREDGSIVPNDGTNYDALAATLARETARCTENYLNNDVRLGSTCPFTNVATLAELRAQREVLQVLRKVMEQWEDIKAREAALTSGE